MDLDHQRLRFLLASLQETQVDVLQAYIGAAPGLAGSSAAVPGVAPLGGPRRVRSRAAGCYARLRNKASSLKRLPDPPSPT
jgi:hypothetical protein